MRQTPDGSHPAPVHSGRVLGDGGRETPRGVQDLAGGMAMIRLTPMPQKDLRQYRDIVVPELAQELSQAHDLAWEDGLAAARASFARLLPGNRVASPDQYLYTIRHARQKVGVLWFGIQRSQGKAEAFVWHIFIYPPYRGQGYGKRAMLALEGKVQELGLGVIRLNVFGHNAIARQLYEQLGYETVSIRMKKYLP